MLWVVSVVILFWLYSLIYTKKTGASLPLIASIKRRLEDLLTFVGKFYIKIIAARLIAATMISLFLWLMVFAFISKDCRNTMKDAETRFQSCEKSIKYGGITLTDHQLRKAKFAAAMALAESGDDVSARQYLRESLRGLGLWSGTDLIKNKTKSICFSR